jgi:hypothetical protein
MDSASKIAAVWKTQIKESITRRKSYVVAGREYPVAKNTVDLDLEEYRNKARRSLELFCLVAKGSFENSP